MLAAPSADHWLGTDAFGRDVLSRLIYGSRTALVVGFGAAFFGATLGAILGVASAYFAGRIDLFLQRVMDVFISFPLIILALAMVAILGNNLPNLITAITIPMIPRAALVIRSSALSVREMPYVDAARAAGFGHARIILRHMLPNVMAPYLIMLTAFLAGHPARSLAVLPRARGAGAHRRVGAHAAGRGRPVRGVRALDGHLSRPGDQSVGLRLQPVRRLVARRAGSQAPHAVGRVWRSPSLRNVDTTREVMYKSTLV
jgi:hypothetical protein